MTTTLNHEFHRVPMAGMGVRPNAKAKVAGVLLLLAALAAIYWVMLETGALTAVTNKAALSEWIDQLGYWGPVGIIGLMITAIVLSPIPSAPIAMVAGAAYGSLWGADESHGGKTALLGKIRGGQRFTGPCEHTFSFILEAEQLQLLEGRS